MKQTDAPFISGYTYFMYAELKEILPHELFEVFVIKVKGSPTPGAYVTSGRSVGYIQFVQTTLENDTLRFNALFIRTYATPITGTIKPDKFWGGFIFTYDIITETPTIHR